MAARRNQAAWERAALDLSGDPGEVVRLDARGIGQVADRVGLTVATVRDALYRGEAQDPDNPRTHLCRPAYRVDSTPLWSVEQVERARAVTRRRGDKVGHGPSLPMVEADADVVGVRQIVAAVGRHEQTVRKWAAGSYVGAASSEFPRPVGRRRQGARRVGNPETVFERAAVCRWLGEVFGEVPSGLSSAAAAVALRDRIDTEDVVEQV